MKFLVVAAFVVALYTKLATSIDPRDASCQTFLQDGLSELIPGINLAAPLTQCLNDAKTAPYLKSCILNCQCTQPTGSLLCNVMLEACGLNCAVQNQPASCVNFFGDVISDVIGDLSKLNEAYSFIAGFFECLFSAPEIPQPPVTPEPQPPPVASNCPTTIASVGPASCGSFPGVQNSVDCLLQANVVVISYGSGQLACGTVQPMLCGQTTFPSAAAAYWCDYCIANSGGIIDTSCFETYFGVPAQSTACVAYPSCPQANVAPPVS